MILKTFSHRNSGFLFLYDVKNPLFYESSNRKCFLSLYVPLEDITLLGDLVTDSYLEQNLRLVPLNSKLTDLALDTKNDNAIIMVNVPNISNLMSKARHSLYFEVSNPSVDYDWVFCKIKSFMKSTGKASLVGSKVF